ncbi:pyruvate dehydrogenase complex dihydrolipoyllysine-residue acetyltransferase [Shewanella oneidensis MR-1]|uniref:Acetyltransferase component of pyruvate dehydrogenase complex n=1 Tax=Shewanella oneidensis (strain ATCC 700550 / JCM 31522 / CIP 106686 / LMG 19005 / NCIMB 14063 / MR-1) TaxID=211586 RepID=Q8EJN8_SHEON|nr:pyruvate dehydrogenase complex dihydrolipoyllysine-residue acetyltransferase [Shewanella oneidensis]AAN53507.1 dihydrolipoamide acetyltransferase AceF [Shewanella oneidensis MR-1]MDX5997625.1 pyruvate dehydrogenase complex dihydrolipoyllysine-residue acetyltransferase [Shewanella oneidensis]MEE2027662.1 Dihydrolipoyllysine-residue acetyltransferase component of pyruvate dehydrogenase complex [Shewanella oneidensis]QKG95353.1 pyruvate dehydrogenase complex dihydrolipoyllysine-residue acetyltr
MAELKEVFVPDIGGDEVQVIEICAAVGDTLAAEESILTVESDKATMDIPAPFAGVLAELKVAVGDKVSEGTLIALIQAAGASAQAAAPVAQAAAPAPAPVQAAPAPVVAAPATGATKLVEAKVVEISVPDIGGDTDVSVIEVLVAAGDKIEVDAGLITLETDKATMDVPSPFAGVVKEVKVAVGDKVSQGSLVIMLEVGGAAPAAAPQANAPAASAPVAQAAPAAAVAPVAAVPVVAVKEIQVPDIGDASNVDVIEVLVSVGDMISADQGLITLETDKATMEVPAPFAGKLLSLTVKVGDKVSQGSVIATIETTSVATVSAGAATAPVAQAAAPAPVAQEAAPAPVAAAPSRPPVPHHPSAGAPVSTGAVHASPAVRRLAREFGVDLTQVTGSGRKGRIMKEDVQAYVKYELSRPKATAATSVATGNGGGLQVIAAPKVDFSKFGEVEEIPLSRIQKISGPNLHRNWVTIPHVTQFDEADITEMEEFRKQQNDAAAKKKADYKITPLVFMMKAVAKTLQQFPVFNSSLSSDGESLIQKKYFHIGVAVDTPNGLVVPVVRDVDKKGIIELSRELADISIRARDGKLKSADMQGSCFTISSLGGIGGTAFTPIVNYPDVAILGVSKSEIKPKWNGKEFEPKLMLPLSLSYDHRVIDGAMAARFSVTLSGILSDIRTLIL